MAGELFHSKIAEAELIVRREPDGEKRALDLLYGRLQQEFGEKSGLGGYSE